jgi:hypothetical protein
MVKTKLNKVALKREINVRGNSLNPPHQSLCLYVYPPIVARQRLNNKVTAATNTRSTAEELLDSFQNFLLIKQTKYSEPNIKKSSFLMKGQEKSFDPPSHLVMMRTLFGN